MILDRDALAYPRRKRCKLGKTGLPSGRLGADFAAEGEAIGVTNTAYYGISLASRQTLVIRA